MFRIINYNVEKECNEFLRKKVQDWQSEYQTDAIPIPTFASTDLNSVNFIGRLAREILRQTDPKWVSAIANTIGKILMDFFFLFQSFRTGIYIDMQSAWYDYKTHKKLLNMNFLSKIIDSIGPAGLVGLDKLYSHMIKSELDALLASLQKNVFMEKAMAEPLAAFEADVAPLASSVAQPTKLYATYTSKLSKVWPKILNLILCIGQKQIIRKHIANELNSSCKFNSKNLDSSLRTINELVEIFIH